jgi:hypothetical protein
VAAFIDCLFERLRRSFRFVKSGTAEIRTQVRRTPCAEDTATPRSRTLGEGGVLIKGFALVTRVPARDGVGNAGASVSLGDVDTGTVDGDIIKRPALACRSGVDTDGILLGGHGDGRFRDSPRRVGLDGVDSLLPAFDGRILDGPRAGRSRGEDPDIPGFEGGIFERPRAAREGGHEASIALADLRVLDRPVTSCPGGVDAVRAGSTTTTAATVQSPLVPRTNTPL